MFILLLAYVTHTHTHPVVPVWYWDVILLDLKMDSVPLSYTKWTAPACMHVLPYEPCHNSIKLFETCKKWHKFSLFICPIHFVTNRSAFVDFDLYGTGQAVNKVSLNDHVSLTCKCIDLVNQSECLLVWWLSSTCKFHSLIRYGQENCIGGASAISIALMLY